MKRIIWIYAVCIAMLLLAAGPGFAQGKGKGKGKGHNKHQQQAEHDFRYSERDRQNARGWYNDHQGNLPPGLAKRDELPPGLERQLRARGTLPPGLRKKIAPCPPALVQYFPPPPPGYTHVLIGGHIVLLNRQTFMVMDILRLER